MIRRLLTRALSSETLLQRARMRARTAITVLMYHELLADDEPAEAWTALPISSFVRQIEYLKAHFEILSIDAALERGPAERPAVVLTFDDGGAGNHRHLLPLVDQLAVPVAVFIATGQIESGRPYWFDRVMNALQVDRPVRLDLRPLGLGEYEVGPPSGAANWTRIQRLLVDIKAAGVERNDELADAVELRARQSGFAARGPLQPMSIEQVRELAQCKYVTIGAHSHAHSLLTQLPASAVAADIGHSREQLRAWTGQPVTHFAYPSGAHDASVRREVSRAGFRTAFTTEETLWRPGGDDLAIPRMGVGRYDSLDRFKLALSGGPRAVARSLM
jgi:peptidoglycan/xylan/chitin deacetylase (PgdA/CDA1 family)